MTILATHGFPWAELVISLIGGLIGGLTGGFFAVLAQDKAIRAQRKSDREAEEREVNGVLKSIEHELNEIEHGFLAPLEAAFPESRKSDQSGLPLKTPSINQNLFTIYDSNAGKIGKVADANTRHLIVRIYTSAKLSVDILNQYNRTYQVWDRLRHGFGTEPSQAQQILPELSHWASEMRRATSALRELLRVLVPRLKEQSAGSSDIKRP